MYYLGLHGHKIDFVVRSQNYFVFFFYAIYLSIHSGFLHFENLGTPKTNHLFIQQIFIESLLCVEYSFRHLDI